MTIGVVLATCATAEDEETDSAALALAEFGQWKSTGKQPEGFLEHAILGERPDLVERILGADKLAETELKATAGTRTLEVTIQSRNPASTKLSEQDSGHPTVWRRITRNRFEIWTPKVGKLFDDHGRQVAEATVHRSDGHGREWYGAFLPDGRWVTTDIGDYDRELTMFSAKGRHQWTIKGSTLIPADEGADSTPLIAWARSNQRGDAWIVSVGSEEGRGQVMVGPDGHATRIKSPWTECLPQQLGPRGMFTGKTVQSDDGSLTLVRHEAGHGMYVGWPTYEFPGGVSVLVPEGEKFGILPGAWAVFVQKCNEYSFESTEEQRATERTWFFDSKGTYQHWINGRTLGTSSATGGLWIRMANEDCVRVDKDFKLESRQRFITDKKSLIPIELHDDIGLGLFLLDEKLVLGTWKTK